MTSVFEEENLPKAILRVGLPAMLGQLTTLIYNMADTFFVSLTKEPAMIAAVTLCTPILLIIMSIACVFGMGGSSVIARLLGEGKQEYAGRTLHFCPWAGEPPVPPQPLPWDLSAPVCTILPAFSASPDEAMNCSLC